MAIGFGFKWNLSHSQCINRVITFRIDLLCLHLDNSELRLDLSATREHANTHINFKTPLMKIENGVLRNECRRIRSPSLRQFVSIFTPRLLWLTWANKESLLPFLSFETLNMHFPHIFVPALWLQTYWKRLIKSCIILSRWMLHHEHSGRFCLPYFSNGFMSINGSSSVIFVQQSQTLGLYFFHWLCFKSPKLPPKCNTATEYNGLAMLFEPYCMLIPFQR